MIKEIFIGFSAHRLETIPFYEKLFAKSDIIILEDAPHPLFPSLLLGQLTPEQYVQSLETDFPRFLTAQYKLLQAVYKKGKKIVQIDPYIERLLQMYQLLEEGKTPEEISQLSLYQEIYACEHEASGRLLDYYQATMGEFEGAIKAVQVFAQADAKRIALRDKMRAQSIASYLENKAGRVFVEAGYIHLFLSRYLRQALPSEWQIKAGYLLAKPAREIAQQVLGRPLPHPFVPGDILTFWYIGGKKVNPQRANLLAARVLIYNKLISTEELEPTKENPFPHLLQEFKIKAMLRRLSYDDCARLYELVKVLPPARVWQLVERISTTT